MLTYAQCPHDALEVKCHVEAICAMKGWAISKLIWTNEKHKDGHNHVHIGLGFGKRPNCKDVTIFDLNCRCEECMKHEDNIDMHPNWRPGNGKAAWEIIWTYINKCGRAEGDDFISKTFRGYARARMDKQAWLNDAKARNPLDPFPIKMPDGTVVEKPKGYLRKCIYWIVGTPFKGKTWWRLCNLGENDYYLVSSTTHPMEKYNGEQVIVFDDWDWGSLRDPKSFLIACCAYDVKPVAVPGACRYYTPEFPPKRQRIIIVLCNDLPGFQGLDWCGDPNTGRTAAVYNL